MLRAMSDASTSTADPYEAMADELSSLGRRLDGIGTELRALRTATGPAPAPTTQTTDATVDRNPPGARDPGPPPAEPAPAGPGRPAWPQPGWPYRIAPEPAWPYQQVPAPQPAQPSQHVEQEAPRPVPAEAQWAQRQWAPQAWQPPAAAPPAPRRRFSGLSGFRLLAWLGGAVTLLGVVMLLVLVASRGLLTPPFRIGGGALLGLVLIGVALRLHRRPSARTGAIAVAATGFATLYLVVAADAALYGYLRPVPATALAAAFVVAAAGLGLADRWRSQLLGAGVVAGAALLAPVLVGDWLLVALVLALQLAAVPVLLRRGWPVLMLVAAAGPVLYGSAVGATWVADGDLPTIAVVLGVLLVGLGTAVPAARRLTEAPAAVLVGVAPLAAMVTGSVLDGWSGAGVVAAATLALAGTALVSRDRVRLVAAIAAVLTLLQATLIALDGSAAVTVLLAEAALAAVAGAAVRSRFATVVGGGLGLYGSLAAVSGPAVPPADWPMSPYVVDGVVSSDALVTAAGIAALVLVTAVALLVACGRLGWIGRAASSARLWVPIGLVGLYGAGTLVVALALLVAPDRTGFTAGHALVTVSWTVVALVLLARGVTRPPLRIAGLVLVGGAVAKLVLFDLVALDGLARVGAFLGAGLVLLVAGTRYARLVAEAETKTEQPAASAPPA
jgi:uncharacterized membrane protein